MQGYFLENFCTTQEPFYFIKKEKTNIIHNSSRITLQLQLQDCTTTTEQSKSLKNILSDSSHTLPLLHGMTSGFLSSISYKSSTFDRRGSTAFSLSAKSPGREGLPLFWARTRSAPTITMAMTSSTATTPIRIPRTGFSSNGTGVPALQSQHICT